MADDTMAMTIFTVHSDCRELFGYEENQKFVALEEESQQPTPLVARTERDITP